MEPTHLLEMLREVRTDLREGFDGVHDRLDALNGRTRQNEQDIAVLRDRATAAKQKAEEVATTAEVVAAQAEVLADQAAQRAKYWGAALGGGVVALVEALRVIF